MSLTSVLKTIGKDLKDVGTWVSDGLAIAAPIIGAIDPPLAPIIMAIENALAAIPAGTTIDAKIMQSIVTAAAVITPVAPPSCCCCCCRMR